MDPADSTTERTRVVGRFGFVLVIAVGVILGIHPPADSDLYDNGERILDHIDAFWVAIHLLAGILILGLPLVVWQWSRQLRTVTASVFGDLAALVGVIAAGLAVLHLLATDTTSFLAFSDTFEEGRGSHAVVIGADVLLRLHASTLVAFSVSFFVVWPATLCAAAWFDGRLPKWYSALPGLGAVLGFASVIVTLAERQWTTLSEMVLFRSSAVIFLAWLLLTTWWMRRGTILPSPESDTGDATTAEEVVA